MCIILLTRELLRDQISFDVKRYASFSHENQSNSDAKVLIRVNSHSQNDRNIQLYARGSLTCNAFYCGDAFNVENRLIIIHGPHK